MEIGFYIYKGKKGNDAFNVYTSEKGFTMIRRLGYSPIQLGKNQIIKILGDRFDCEKMIKVTEEEARAVHENNNAEINKIFAVAKDKFCNNK